MSQLNRACGRHFLEFVPSPGPAAVLDVYGFPSPVYAGTIHTFTVTARDGYGNVTPAYQGTVHFTSTDHQATLPQDYTFTGGDGGSKEFGAVLNTVGTQAIAAADVANGS